MVRLWTEIGQEKVKFWSVLNSKLLGKKRKIDMTTFKKIALNTWKISCKLKVAYSSCSVLSSPFY